MHPGLQWNFSYQLAGGFAGFGYSFVMTLVILAIMQIISIGVPSLGIRATAREGEQVRLDVSQLDDEAV
jgi:ammonia channel protein AmtB